MIGLGSDKNPSQEIHMLNENRGGNPGRYQCICICICKKRKRGVASNWWVILVCGQSITVNEDAQYLLPTSIYNLSFSQKTLPAKSARKLGFFESVEKWRPGWDRGLEKEG